MMGGVKAHYDGIVAFSQTDFTEDLKKITVPVLVMHGDDGQIVPYEDAGILSVMLVQNGTLKIYPARPVIHSGQPAVSTWSRVKSGRCHVLGRDEPSVSSA
jgi:pimeloyl-ACP methyl ester carboxylesterase